MWLMNGQGNAGPSDSGSVIAWQSNAVQQHSPDGRWWWDGTNWLPTHKTRRLSHGRGALRAVASVLVLGLGTCAALTYLQGGRQPDLNDTWTWDGTNWVKAQSGPAPPWREDAVFVYSDASKLILLFGGFGDPVRDDTWTFDGRRWAKEHSADEPSARFGALAAYDPIGRQVIMFGGSPCFGLQCYPLADTWSWADGEWRELHPASSPPSSFTYDDLVFDPVKSRLTLFGNQGVIDAGQPIFIPETWVWEKSTWTELQPSAPGSVPCCDSSILYADTNAGAITKVTFDLSAGTGNRPSPVAQVWNGSTWAQNRPVVWPPPTIGVGHSFFPPKGYLLTFGGDTCHVNNRTDSVAETWTWNGSSWRLLHPNTSPPPRFFTYLAYDSALSRGVMFGGSASGLC
jgi:hypothetical protein